MPNSKQNGGNGKPKGLLNNVFFYIFIGLILFFITGPLFQGDLTTETKPISELFSQISQGNVQKITVDGDTVIATLKSGAKFISKKETTISFDQLLVNNKIDMTKVPGGVEIKESLPLAGILISVAQIGLPLLLLFFLFKQLRGGAGDILSFAKSKAKLFNKNSPQLKFSDVAGAAEAKAELIEIVDFLKSPAKYRALGARIPKGVLLVGPAGVGKTMLAKAVAGEAGVPFFSVAGSEFMEMLVGVGSARVRDLFDMAKASQPSLIFIDEIDAIGRQRGMGIGGGHDEREQTLNQILVEMDGFDPRTSVIVIAATNRPDMLDPALVRPGRFDRRVVLSLPDLKERQEIIKIHMRGKPFGEGIDTEKLAKRTVGFSGADIENMLNESAILAARQGQKAIAARDLEEAALKVQLGPEKRKMQSEEERKLVAYHEAGHAIVAAFTENMDPLHRISIISRGVSLGYTLFPPSTERYNETRKRLISMITTSLGGRSAEELVFSEMTVGASNDIEKATEIARKMVVEFGMSSLGPINLDTGGDSFWLARQFGEGSGVSDEFAAKIDHEIKKIIDEAHSRALEVLTKHRDKLDLVAGELMKKETLEGGEFEALVGLKPAPSL